MPEYILPVEAPTLEQMSSPDPHLKQLLGPIDTHIAEPISDRKQFQQPDMLSRMASTPNPESRYEPQTFDWDKSGAQKFVNSDHYKQLGFDPQLGEGNELKYAQHQTGWEETKRGIGGAVSGFIHGFSDQAKSIGNFATMFSDASLRESFTQAQSEEINRKNQEFDNNWHIFQGEDPTIWSSFTKEMQGAGHLLGAIGELAAETALTNAIIAASFGAAAPLEGYESARWAALGMKEAEGAGMAQRAAQAGIRYDRIINNSSVLGKTWAKAGEFAASASRVLPVVGNTVRYAGELAAYGAEGGAMATIGRGIGAFIQDARGINLATSFASGNAAATYQQLLSDQIETYKRQNGGREPGYGDLESYKDRAIQGAKTDGAINAWAMLMMEKVAFGNILNNRRTLQEALQRTGRDTYDRIAMKPSWVEGAADAPLYMKQQAKWYNMKANYYAIPRELGISAATHGLSFGATMNIMDGVDKGVRSYYDAKYDNKDVDVFDGIREGFNSQFTKEGAKTFISGMLTGALVMGIGGAALRKGVTALTDRYGNKNLDRGIDVEAETKQKDTDAKEFVDKVNDMWKNPLNEIKSTLHNLALQNSIKETANSALSAGDRKGYHDIKDDADREFFLKMIRNGLADAWTDRMLEQARDLSPEELTKMMDLENTPENYEQLRNQIDAIPGRVKDLRRISREVDGKLGNPFNPFVKGPDGNRLYPDGSEEFVIEANNAQVYQTAKDYTIMLKDNAERGMVRQSDLLNGNRGTTGILDMPFATNLDFSTIHTALSLDELSNRIAEYDQVLKIDPTDKASITGRKVYEQYRNVLQEFHDEYNRILDKGEYPNRQRDIDALTKLYHDELTKELYPLLDESVTTRDAKGKVVNKEPVPLINEVHDGMEKILDYYKLGMETDKVNKVLNTVLDPSLIRQYQMSFMKEGAKRQAQAEEPITTSQPESTTTEQPVSTNTTTPEEKRATISKDEKDKLINDIEERRNESMNSLAMVTTEDYPSWRWRASYKENKVLKSMYEKEKGDLIKAINKKYDDELKNLPGISNEPEVYTEKNIEDIRTSIAEWATQLRGQDIHPSDIIALTPDAKLEMAENKEFKQLVNAAINIYHDDHEGLTREVNKILITHFDRAVQPLDYSHLPDKPKVEVDGKQWKMTGIDKKFDSVREANKALESKYPKFDVQGRQFQVGQHLYDESGKQYLLKDRDVIVPISGRKQLPIKADNARLLSMTDSKSQPVSWKVEIPKNRLQNINEIAEIHPPGFTEAEMAANQVIIDQVLSAIPTDELSDHLSIVVTTNPPRTDVTYDNDLTRDNPYITINREPNTVAIYRIGKDKPMSYITHPGKYTFTFDGKQYQVPPKDKFELVYDLHGKPLDEVYNQWVENYNKSQQLAEVIDRITKQTGGQLTGAKLDKYLKLVMSTGSYEYISRSESDKWPTVQDTVDTGKKLLSVIDQRTGDVVYGTHDKKNSLPKEPNQMGGYMAEIQLENDTVRYAQMVSPSYTEAGPEEFNTVVAEYITKSSQDIRKLVGEGKLKEAEVQSKLSTSKLKQVFITQGPKKDTAEVGDRVVTFNMTMSTKGTVGVGLKIDTRTDTGWTTMEGNPHIVINSGPGIDIAATGEQFIKSLETKTNNYLKKLNIAPVEIGMHNIRKGYNRDENGRIPIDIVMNSKITTTTNIVRDIKLNYIVDKSALYQDVVPTDTGNVPRGTDKRAVIEAKRQKELSDIDSTDRLSVLVSKYPGLTVTQGVNAIEYTKNNARNIVNEKYDKELQALEQKPVQAVEAVVDEEQGIDDDYLFQLQQSTFNQDIMFHPAQFTTVMYDKSIGKWIMQIDSDAQIGGEREFHKDSWIYTYAPWLEGDEYSKYRLNDGNIESVHISKGEYDRERGDRDDNPFSVKEITFQQAKEMWENYQKHQVDTQEFAARNADPWAEQVVETGYTPVKTEEQQIQELTDKHGDDFDAIVDDLSARKLVPSGTGFSEQDIVDIDQFKQDIAAKLPEFISVSDTLIPAMVNGYVTVGEFITHIDALGQVRGVIRTNPQAPYKYHEAFHSVYRLLLTPEQQKRLIDEQARKHPVTAEEFNKFRDGYGSHATKDEYYEEQIADRFDKWKSNNRTPLTSGIREWFRKLWAMIRELFSRLSGNQIEAMFYKYDRAGYKHAKLQENSTTATPNSTALKLIEVGTQPYTGPDGKTVDIPRYLGQQDSVRLSSTIAALYHMDSLENKSNKRKLIEHILNNYKDTLYPKQDRYRDIHKNLYKANPVNASAWITRLTEQYSVFSKAASRESLIEAVDEHLKVMGYRQDINDETVATVENQVGSRNYDTTADQVGGYESLQGAIREYIGSTIVPYTDEFGNSDMAGGQPMYQAVDGSKVYNGLTQLLKNVPDINQMVQVMVRASDIGTGDTGAVIRRLISDTGFTVTGDGTWNITKNSQLFIQFLNGFSQVSVNHIFVEAGTGAGIVGATTRSYEANRQSGAANQLAISAEAFDSVYQQGYDSTTAKKTYAKEHVKPLGELRVQVLDRNAEYSDDNEFVDNAQELSNSIKEQLGLSIHPMYIQYSIAHAQTEPSPYMTKLLSTWKADPITVADIEAIRTVILDQRNPFTDALTNLRNIATGSAVFDDSVDSTTYRNAENKDIHGFQKYNYITQKGIEFNTDEGIEKLREDPNTQICHLLDDEKWLNHKKEISLVDGIALRYHEGTGEDIETPNYDTNRSAGSAMKHFNPRELNYYHMGLVDGAKERNGVWAYNVVMAIISDKNSLYMVNVPLIHSVYNDKNSKLRISEGAIDKLYNVVQEEAARMERVTSEIADQPISEHIDDWHNEKLNGLKFDRARQMLGEYIDEKGYLKEDADMREVPVKRLIQSYFMDNGGAIDQYIDDLVDQGLITRDGNTYVNRLLPEYLWKGISGKKGDGLNMSSGKSGSENFRHNIAQIYISNYINADGYMHLLSPNGINTKRTSFLNASGDVAAKPNMTAPELGIHTPFTDIHVAIVEDPKDENRFDYADSQGYITEKGMRNMHWGYGTLSKERADAITKIQRGQQLTAEEVLGRGGLMESGDMLNPLKPVYYDGYTGLKMSVTMLSRNQVMVRDANNKWIPDIRRMRLYNIWKSMNDHETANDSVCMVLPKSASKLQTKNVTTADNINNSHFTELDAQYLRKQLDNVDKGIHNMTKPTQTVWQLGAEQDDNTEVYGQKIGDIRRQYGQDIAQRLLVNWNNALSGILEISGDKPVNISDVDVDKLTPMMGRFYEQMKETLQATGANEQTLGFMETRPDVYGVPQPVYLALDFPATLEKYTQQVLNYFGKAMYEKVPGIDATKVSSYGYQVLRQVHEVDDMGTPVPGMWSVISDSEYMADPQRYADAKGYTDEVNRTHTGLKVGDVIIDHLRANVPQYRDGKPTDMSYNECLMPIAHVDDDGTAESPMAMTYGVRIPYADKNSGGVELRVGTLPVELGSIHVGSSAESRAAGEDHDLDKRKMQIYDTYTDGKNLIRYGTATTDKDKFEEYLMYQSTNNSRVKKAVEELTGSSMEVFTAALLGDDRQVLIAAMKELKLPSAVTEYMAAGGDNLNVGVLNNRELDAKIAMAGNSHITGGDNAINLQPTSTDLLSDLINPDNGNSIYQILNRRLEDSELTDVGRKNIEAMMESFTRSSININEMRGQSATASMIWPAKGSVGVAANGVPVLSYVLQHHIPITGDHIRYNGVDYNKLGADKTTDGTRKFAVIMTYVNTMTDNAKLDGLAAKLGLTREALSDAMTMGLTGINIDDAVLYMLQPAVRKYYKDITYISGTLKTFDEEKLSKKIVLQDAIDRYTDKPIELTRGDLENGLVEPHDQVQLSALLDIQKASKLGESIFQLSQVLGLVSGPGISWEEVDNTLRTLDDLKNSKVIDVWDTLTKQDPITSRYIEMLTQLDKISPLLFMERSDLFKRLKATSDANLRPLRKSEIDTVTKQRKQDLISYLTIAHMMHDKGKGSLSNSLIYDTLGGETITEVTNRLKETLKGRKANYFVNNFIREVNKGGVSLVNANNWAKLSEHRQIQLRDSLMQLMNTPATREDGMKLFNYLLVKDGGQFRTGSFIKFVAPAVFKDLLDSTANVKKAMVLKQYSDTDAQRLFGKDWSAVMNDYISHTSTHIDNKQYLKYIRLPYTNTNAIYRAEGNLQIDLMKGDIAENVKALSEAKFNIITVDSGKKDDKGKAIMHRHVEFPQTINTSTGIYRLLNNRIEKGDTVAHGTRAVYQPTENTGARGTYKAQGALYGPVPDTKNLTKGVQPQIVTIQPYSPNSTVKPTEQVQVPQQLQVLPDTPQEAIKQQAEQGVYTANIGGQVVQIDDKGKQVQLSSEFDEEEGLSADDIAEIAAARAMKPAEPVVPSPSDGDVEKGLRDCGLL